MALDLGVHRKRPQVLSLREALAWTSLYITLAMGFCLLVYFIYQHNWLGAGVEWREDLTGAEASLKFFTAWLLEWSLSLDNIFVIALIFSHFQVPTEQQHRVLFGGILGTLVLRATMVLAGIVLGDRALSLLRRNALSAETLLLIDEAPRYGEGTGFRIPVNSEADCAAAEVIIEAKMS